MKNKRGVIPAKCRACSKGFDLSYDLQNLSGRMTQEEILAAIALIGKRGLLCWQCRMPLAMQTSV